MFVFVFVLRGLGYVSETDAEDVNQRRYIPPEMNEIVQTPHIG